MPFSLNNAAKAFTKAMKHPVAKVRALGFKVRIYLGDWIPAARTRPLCLKQSLSQCLINSLRKLGFRINFKKIQSGSIPNKKRVRFCHQFKEHDDFFTPQKNRKSDKESPGSQKQNESLLERNKSISGPMQFKRTSSPTGSFSLLFSSEAINSKFKAVHKSSSVRLLNCS